MSQRVAVAARRRRRLITYAWVSAMALGIIILIYKEQTALLYILATLGITALLVIVALADLRVGNALTEGDANAATASPVDTAGNPARARSGARSRS